MKTVTMPRQCLAFDSRAENVATSSSVYDPRRPLALQTPALKLSTRVLWGHPPRCHLEALVRGVWEQRVEKSERRFQQEG